MNKILCIISRPPYQGSHDLELIEAAMVGAVFDMQVSILFRDEGVWALLDGQDAGPLEQRTFSKVLSALPAYEVDKLYVCSESLNQRGVSPDQFCIAATPLSVAEQQTLIAEHEAVLGAQA